MKKLTFILVALIVLATITFGQQTKSNDIDYYVTHVFKTSTKVTMKDSTTTTTKKVVNVVSISEIDAEIVITIYNPATYAYKTYICSLIEYEDTYVICDYSTSKTQYTIEIFDWEQIKITNETTGNAEFYKNPEHFLYCKPLYH